MNLYVNHLTNDNKAALLEYMDNYLRAHISDEELFDEWLTLGIPDESKKEDYPEMAKDEEFINNCLYMFVKIVLNDE